MRREFKVEVNQGEPQVEYKEALQNLLNIEKHTRNNQEVVVNSVISYLN
jgi:translation elongation factor EF-G